MAIKCQEGHFVQIEKAVMKYSSKLSSFCLCECRLKALRGFEQLKNFGASF